MWLKAHGNEVVKASLSLTYARVFLFDSSAGARAINILSRPSFGPRSCDGVQPHHRSRTELLYARQSEVSGWDGKGPVLCTPPTMA